MSTRPEPNPRIKNPLSYGPYATAVTSFISGITLACSILFSAFRFINSRASPAVDSASKTNLFYATYFDSVLATHFSIGAFKNNVLVKLISNSNASL